MEKDYYLLGEILLVLKKYFFDSEELDYLKDYFIFPEGKDSYYTKDKVHFKLWKNSTSNCRDLCVDSMYIAKDDNNNYIVGYETSIDDSDTIYRAYSGRKIFNRECKIRINPDMMNEFHEEYTKIMDSVNSIRDYRIDLGSFDGLSYCEIMIEKEWFGFQTGNYSETPQYERDKRRFFIWCNNDKDDRIYFHNEIYDENLVETFIKILTIKIPKKLLHSVHQQMIENSGVLDNPTQTIFDIIKTTYTPFDKTNHRYVKEVLEQKIKKLI